MIAIQTTLLGKHVRLKSKDGDGEPFDGANGRGTIVAVYYTGRGLMMLVALDADTSYRDSPKERVLVQVHWSEVAGVL